MSQFPNAPPPGTYVPPTGQPQYGSQYGQPPAQGYAPLQKSTLGFGQMLNQAVTTGKPMLNKLGKTLNSKLGSKHPSSAPPQHLESYHNYQEHQQQSQPQSYPHQPQQFSPQLLQQQWQQQQSQNAYPTPQQSPYAQSNNATPASGHSGQSNYFPQQTPQAPQQQSNAPNYTPTQYTQGQMGGAQQQGQTPHGQSQGQFNQNQHQGQLSGQFQQPQQEQFAGQQTGVIGSSQPAPQNVHHASLQFTPQPGQPNQQQQWSSQPSAPVDMNAANPTSPPIQHAQPFNPTPPPQPFGSAPVQQSQQQWGAMSPITPHGQAPTQIPSSVSPPPPQSAGSGQHQLPSAPAPSQQQQSQPQTPAPQNAPPQPAPTEFIAELPADLGNLSLAESSKPNRPPSSPPSQPSPYQAYQPTQPSQDPSPKTSYTIPRRAVSMSSLPLADPWRFADPTTELPTREFYMIADLIFDALDRKFEPQGTGMLEASKLLASWRVTGFTEEATQLFEHDSYSAFAKLWILEGIPHVMLPCQPALMPVWNFQQQSHSQEMRIPMEPPSADTASPTYMPALNRAGWYKSFFLDMLHEPEGLEKMLQAFCSDTYKPGILNQPDVQKRDKTAIPSLGSRAAAIQQAAIPQVYREMRAVVQAAKGAQAAAAPAQTGVAPAPAQGSDGMTAEEMAVRMHGLKMQQQFNNMMVHTMLPGGIASSAPATGYGSLV